MNSPPVAHLIAELAGENQLDVGHLINSPRWQGPTGAILLAEVLLLAAGNQL